MNIMVRGITRLIILCSLLAPIRPVRIYLSDSATRKLVNAGRKREIPLYISLFARQFGAAMLSKLPNVVELREASRN